MNLIVILKIYNSSYYLVVVITSPLDTFSHSFIPPLTTPPPHPTTSRVTAITPPYSTYC